MCDIERNEAMPGDGRTVGRLKNCLRGPHFSFISLSPHPPHFVEDRRKRKCHFSGDIAEGYLLQKKALS